MWLSPSTLNFVNNQTGWLAGWIAVNESSHIGKRTGTETEENTENHLISMCFHSFLPS